MKFDPAGKLGHSRTPPPITTGNRCMYSELTWDIIIHFRLSILAWVSPQPRLYQAGAVTQSLQLRNRSRKRQVRLLIMDRILSQNFQNSVTFLLNSPATVE